LATFSNKLNVYGLLPGTQLSVSPSTLNFGTVAVGANAQASFVVTNAGGTALTNGVATVSTGPFTILSGTPFSLPGFGATNLVVRFAPTSAASFTNTVTFTGGNGGNSTNAVTGTGASVPVAAFTGYPVSGLRPLMVTFGDTSTGTITNRFWDFGDGANSNTTFTSVAHTYNAAGTYTVVLTVTGPVGTNSQTRSGYIVVTNPPPLLSVSPGNLSFGTLIVGQVSTQSFQVVNSGGITMTGSVATTLPFAIQSGTPFSVAPGQTGQVQVTFSPVSSGNFSNAAVFMSNGGNSTNPVAGNALTPPQISVSPASLNFGTIAVGSNSQSSFVITNRGGATLTNGVATVNAGPFSILSGTPFSLPGFGATNLVVRFAPASAANFTNTVTLTTGNGGNSTNTVTGTGAVVPVAGFTGTPTRGLKPLTVSFTDASTGTITNRFWDFGDGSNTNTALTSFTHTYNAAGTNTVVLTVSGPVGTNTQTRSGYIVVTNPPPLLSVSPGNLSFGTLIVSQTSTQSFQVVNSGGTTLTGTVATTLPFAIQGGSPFTVAPGQTGQVQVSFSPTNSGSFSNVAVFTSNGGNSTNTVTGTGSAVPVAGFTGSPTSGAWPLTVTFADSSTGTITNNFWDFGDGITTNTGPGNVLHTYAGVGTNTVSLTVTGPVGTNNLRRSSYIIVTNPAPVTLTIQLTGSQVQLTWNDGTLQTAVVVTGPYTNITGAVSPYTLPPSEAERFFRVKVR
jgi:PKD repeat protein